MLRPSNTRTEQTLFYHTRTGAVVVVLWTILTVSLVAFTLMTLSYPYWLTNTKSESIGLDQKCTIFSKCDARLLQFSKILTGWWKAVTILIISATIIFCCCPIVLFLWLYLRLVNAKKAFFVTGILQAIGGMYYSYRFDE